MLLQISMVLSLRQDFAERVNCQPIMLVLVGSADSALTRCEEAAIRL